MIIFINKLLKNECKKVNFKFIIFMSTIAKIINIFISIISATGNELNEEIKVKKVNKRKFSSKIM